jgi:HNH endonuclease
MRRGRPRYHRSELERLIDRTVLGPTHPKLGTCWLFTGATTPYGRIGKAQDSYTHRLGWKLLRGAIPDGMELHHRCGVYACWNPDHLQVVTHAENLAFRRKAPRRAAARPRKAVAEGVALPARFWKKVNKNGPIPPLRPELGPCWLHQGTPDRATGYIRCDINRVRDYVHRLVYRALVEPIPAGKEIDHQCHNADPSCPSDASCLHRRCANPDHLEAVTHRENMDRSPNHPVVKNRLKTHCPHGHPYDQANTRVTPNGGRACRACNRAAQQRFRERVAAVTGLSRPKD